MTEQTRRSPFVDLREALEVSDQVGNERIGVPSNAIRVDVNRMHRTGIPEVVFAANKSREDIADGLRRLVEGNGRALASRVRPDDVEAIRATLEPAFSVENVPRARAILASRPEARRPNRGGKVGLVSAGTSDIPVAAEAALVALEMGATVLEAWDVGVAGLHRLIEPLERFADEGVDVIVVAAGMDGALPSVVAGLVDVPVIGLPTSIGYGFGSGGIGALTTMLQSCAPGLVVVNIDNGIGAGSTAALIANRAADSRADRRG